MPSQFLPVDFAACWSSCFHLRLFPSLWRLTASVHLSEPFQLSQHRWESQSCIHSCSIYLLMYPNPAFYCGQEWRIWSRTTGVRFLSPWLANWLCTPPWSWNFIFKMVIKFPFDNHCKGSRNYSKCSTEEKVEWKELCKGLVPAELNLGFPMQFPFQYNHSSPCLPLRSMNSLEKNDSAWTQCERFFIRLVVKSFLGISRKIKECYSFLWKKVKPNDA